MRSNAVPAHRLGKGGGYPNAAAKRVVTVLDNPMFDLLREKAESRGVGLAQVAREYIEDGLAREPQV